MAGRGAAGDVSPAHAGVEASSQVTAMTRLSQPRARGGRGITGELLADTIRSAPRMRG